MAGDGAQEVLLQLMLNGPKRLQFYIELEARAARCLDRPYARFGG